MSFASLRSGIVALLVVAPAALCNPHITIGDPPNGTAVGLDFTFSTDNAGGGYFTFTNDSGEAWTTLDFFFVETPSTTITCASAVFDTCDVSVTPIDRSSSSFDVGFEGTTNSPGIPNGTSFTIDLNNSGTSVNGTGDWCPDTSFTSVANIPEPSYGAAVAGAGLLAGLGAWWRKRRSL